MMRESGVSLRCPSVRATTISLIFVMIVLDGPVPGFGGISVDMGFAQPVEISLAKQRLAQMWVSPGS